MSAFLTVTETGDRMVFNVSSEKKPGKKYRVDLIAMGGYGACACADWAMRRCENITKKKAPMGSRDAHCKHVFVARTHFLNGLLKAMAESETAR